MKITHTSPVEITNIVKTGVFDDCLFFSDSEYVMTAADVVYVYSLDIEDESLISCYELHDDEVIEDIIRVLDVDAEAAESMLCGDTTAFDNGLVGEDDWWIQAKQGECAKKMGYAGCISEDEQGTVYIVPMFGREKELKLEAVK